MKTACIIIPHIDDDIYSCWSVLSDQSYDKIVIVRCTSGESQRKRKEIHDSLITHKGATPILGVNPNIEIRDIFGDFNDSPADGTLEQVDKRIFISAIDKLVREGFEHFFFPSESHHQDHAALYKHCIASLTRDEGHVTQAYAYTYMYNHITENAIAYNVMSEGTLQNKIEFLNLLDKAAKIYTNRKSSAEYVINMNRNSGIDCGADAAETFIPFKIII